LRNAHDARVTVQNANTRSFCWIPVRLTQVGSSRTSSSTLVEFLDRTRARRTRCELLLVLSPHAIIVHRRSFNMQRTSTRLTRTACRAVRRRFDPSLPQIRGTWSVDQSASFRLENNDRRIPPGTERAATNCIDTAVTSCAIQRATNVVARRASGNPGILGRRGRS